ncbi:hypothetical protein HOK51_00755 [Candidatus Woesearchaeota archaeon]|jgi:hypothetical protein|nr:hypothetical protein [Candidatus Woesearchaeota archaeon]MBT6518344.1 hypothetical protein [Candidatus Woesearchaeota archaeon]MBT7366641.1 hypothetical protein [Candidatus Woesearchaeota archaeon]
MTLIKLNPPYRHLYQKPAFCGPCCVQMIFLRRGLWEEQEEIAIELNTGILKKDTIHYSMPPKIVDGKDETKIGVALEKFDIHLNELFKKHKFKLHAKQFDKSEIINPKNFIENNLKEDNDIIVDFWLKQTSNSGVGHFILISGINTESEQLIICDPDGDAKSEWTISITELFDLMDKKWDGNKRGFVVVKKINDK